ncbi:MAG: riboflavin synthase [Dehalococcoidales bacterium]
MFTGIVEETGRVKTATAGKLVISTDTVTRGMKPGDSVAVNGVCLTVTDFDADSFSVDVMPETLAVTNLGRLRAGDRLNLERAVALGGQMGGHLVQGHIDGTGTIAAVTPEAEAIIITVKAPAEIIRYTVQKGFIAVDGISLTVIDRDDNSFRVSVVGYTRRQTTLGEKRAGDPVNLETDIIGKYVEQFTGSQTRSTGITAAFLQEHGFPVN